MTTYYIQQIIKYINKYDYDDAIIRIAKLYDDTITINTPLSKIDKELLEGAMQLYINYYETVYSHKRKYDINDKYATYDDQQDINNHCNKVQSKIESIITSSKSGSSSSKKINVSSSNKTGPAQRGGTNNSKKTTKKKCKT